MFGKGGADSWLRCLERHLVGLGGVLSSGSVEGWSGMVLQLLTWPILLALELIPNVYQILALKVFKLCHKYSHLSLVNGKRLFMMIRS